jgi:NADPH:quinone reductase-like Zn-dependent oxidoreductase
MPPGSDFSALILGGSGGTGSLAIQIAKALGASTIATTTSSKNFDLVKSLGATKVSSFFFVCYNLS